MRIFQYCRAGEFDLKDSVDTTERIPQDLTEMLHKRQRNLRSLRCEAALDLSAPKSIDFDKLRHVQLFIRKNHHLARTQQILAAAHRMETLEICVNVEGYLRTGTTLRNVHTPAEVSESILRTVLGVSDAESKNSPQPNAFRSWPLSVLRIQGLDLSRAATHLFNAIQPSALKELSFQKCRHELSLLRMLASANDGNSLRIRYLEIVQALNLEIETTASHSIDDVLNSFDTLETLIIYAPHTNALRARPQAVSRHHNSLRTLYLEYGHGVREWYWHSHELDRCLTQCDKIEQLALELPSYYWDVHDGNAEEFRDYLVG